MVGFFCWLLKVIVDNFKSWLSVVICVIYKFVYFIRGYKGYKNLLLNDKLVIVLK